MTQQEIVNAKLEIFKAIMSRPDGRYFTTEAMIKEIEEVWNCVKTL